jgi:hypothetical protein
VTAYDEVPMLAWLMVIPLGITILAWLVAAVHAFLLLAHVAPPHTAFSLLFQGFRFFQADTFQPSGHPIQRRFLIAVGVFGLGIALSFALGALVAVFGR